MKTMARISLVLLFATMAACVGDPFLTSEESLRAVDAQHDAGYSFDGSGLQEAAAQHDAAPGSIQEASAPEVAQDAAMVEASSTVDATPAADAVSDAATSVSEVGPACCAPGASKLCSSRHLCECWVDPTTADCANFGPPGFRYLVVCPDVHVSPSAEFECQPAANYPEYRFFCCK